MPGFWILDFGLRNPGVNAILEYPFVVCLTENFTLLKIIELNQKNVSLITKFSAILG
jgi:hypothetical protein